MIKQKTLAASIAAAVGSTAIASGAAIAGTGFWPHIVHSPSVTTVVSIINQSQFGYDPAGNAAFNGGNLHYILYYKPLDGNNDNLESCVEVNQFLPTSYNDIQTVDLGAHFGASTQGVLFNDPSVNNNWQGSGKNYAMAALTGEAALRGYLLVDNSLGAPGSISGDAMLFEYVNGATWGYEALEAANADFDFAVSGNQNATVSLKPWAEIETAFMVTPVNGDMAAAFDREVRLSLGTPGGLSNSVVFDRDENAVSGTDPENVVCVGRVNAMDLLTSGAQNLTPDGGWGDLRITGINDTNMYTTSDAEWVFGAVVYQLEYGMDTFNGESMPGVFNNGYRLFDD